MRCGAAYIRVSTEDQIEFSPDSQLGRIREYAQAHGIEIPERFVFSDEGVSGRHAEKRPAFMQMIGAAKAKPRPFDVILVWKFSRFARNRQDSILYKSMLRRECGVDVISVTEPVTDDPTSILIEALLEAMDEYYSINLAQEVRRGMQEKFTRGGVVSAPPYGYRMGDGRFEPDETCAPFVQLMFERAARGTSCRQIAAELNAMELRTRRGSRFESRSVEYILRNPAYLGKQRRGGKPGDRFRADAEVVDGAHPPLVSAELFRAANRRLEGRAREGGAVRERGGAYLLRGLVRCSACGGVLTRTAGGRALQCGRYAKGLCGRSHYISADKLNAAVLAQLRADLCRPDGPAVALVPDARERAEEEKRRRILCARERKRLARIRAAYESGADTLEEYARRKAACLARLEAFEQQKPEPGETGVRLCLREILDALASGRLSAEAGNRLLRAVVREIRFDRAAGTIALCYYF